MVLLGKMSVPISLFRGLSGFTGLVFDSFQSFQFTHQPPQFRVGINSVVLQLLFHRLVGIGHSLYQATAIPLKITVQSFGFAEEFSRFPILHTLVQFFQ